MRTKTENHSIEKIAHHRNGVGGVPFQVAIMDDPENGKMLVVRFDKQADRGAGGVLCAAFKLELLKGDEITFGINSWRGDHYAAIFDRLVPSEEER